MFLVQYIDVDFSRKRMKTKKWPNLSERTFWMAPCIKISLITMGSENIFSKIMGVRKYFGKKYAIFWKIPPTGYPPVFKKTNP